MSDLFFSTMKRLTPVLLQGDIAGCEREIATEMKRLSITPFHVVLDLFITNSPESAARHFDRFFELESTQFQIGAAYTEMNGFDINPGRWFCDLFAYAADGGQEDNDWISDWQSRRFDDYTISGLETLQRVYASDAFRAEANHTASYMSSLMVVVKFQMFMQRAVSHMKLLQFPLYVTAHDFDFIACFDPRPESAKPRIRKQSVEELTRDLITKLSDDHPHTRFRAAIRLQTIGPAAIGAVAALLERLSDSEMSIRQAAVAALAKIDPESDLVVSALVARLNVDQPLWDKRNIVQALGECPTKKAIEALAMALFDEHTEVRRAAAISLKILGIRAKEAAPALRKLLETELNRDIRTQATTALEMMRQE